MPATLVATPEGFLKRGVEHRVISGGMHYFRVHPEQWRDRLARIALLGCTAVETYVAWNVHEPREGEFHFSGGADLERFLRLAAEIGLDVIVRPGPYICAEWDNGGLPSWLTARQDIVLRAYDPRFLAHVQRYFDAVIPIVARNQASRGGSVIMVQVENEYGSYRTDARYLEYVRDALRERGIEELLVTSDGPGPEWLEGVQVPGVLPTVNFGSRAAEIDAQMRELLPGQPLMCMEFWNGWFDHFGSTHHVREADDAARELRDMLNLGWSVNFYMAHGGTNVGLSAGANRDTAYRPTITSYDYDAPIAEDGTLTQKFFACRDVIADFRGDLPPLREHMRALGVSESIEHIPARELAVEHVVDVRSTELFTGPGTPFLRTPSFDEVGLDRGMLRMSARIRLGPHRWDPSGQLADLRFYDLHDRAFVYMDGHFVGVTDVAASGERVVSLPLAHATSILLPDGQPRDVRIDVLVEGMGRVNYGPSIGERKGALGGIWHLTRFVGPWEVAAWPLEDMAKTLAALVRDSAPEQPASHGLPAVVATSFDTEQPRDTYLDIREAGYGVAFVNGVCVGRYWDVGPQGALYVPAPLIRSGRNEVYLLEFERIPSRLALTEGPVWWDGTGNPSGS